MGSGGFAGGTFIFGLIPFVALIGWIITFRKNKLLAILLFSILLLVFDLPHIFYFRELLESNPGVTGMILIYFGFGCFALGVFGIIFSAIKMGRK